MTTATTADARMKTAQIMLLIAAFSIICHWAIVPVAAWNHNLALVIIAALSPMIGISVLRKLGKIPTNVNRIPVKSIVRLVIRTAIVTFFCWNHLWLIAIAAVLIMSIYKNRNKSK